MKITIEITSSVSATVECEGRKFIYSGHGLAEGGSIWQFKAADGGPEFRSNESIAGFVVGKLTWDLSDVMQAYLPDRESPDGDCWEPWEKLDDETQDEMREKLG